MGLYKFSISNNTDVELIIFCKEKNNGKLNRILAEPQAVVEIGSFRTTNGLYDYDVNPAQEFFDTLRVVTSEGLNLTKSLSLRENWEYKAEATGKVLLVKSGINNYSFAIGMDDLK